MDFVLTLHSIVRWVIVIVALAAIVRAALVWAGRAQPSSMDRGLMSGFTGSMDLNVLLGLILIIGLGFTAQRIEHAVTNIVAVAVAHIFVQRAKKIDNAKLKAQMHGLGVAISLLIIVLGVSLVNGWTR
jgi:hypothetical protein